MHAEYYEAVIQIRPRNSEIERFFMKMLEKNAKARLSKRKKLKEGVDYYVSSHRFATATGRVLVKEFGGSVKVSKKTFGRRLGKTIFRYTVLYRLPDLRKGEVVVFDGYPHIITSLGKFAIGKNLATGKRERIDFNSEIKKLEKKTAIVSRSRPLEVISSEDYQSVRVENKEESEERRLVVVNYRNRIYLAE